MSFTRRNNTNSGYNNAMNTRSARGGSQQQFVAGGQFVQGSKPMVQLPLRHSNQTSWPQQQQVRPQHQQQQVRPQQQQPIQQTQVPQVHALPAVPLKSALKKSTLTVQQPSPQQQPPSLQQQQQQQSPPQQPTQVQPQIIQSKVEPPMTPIAAAATAAATATATATATVTATATTSLPLPTNEIDMNTSDNEENGDKKKKIFFKAAGKISKKERRGRRNQRLRKILQPKNALMVLNELLGGQKFSVIEKDPKAMTDQFYTEPDTFIASVSVEGVDHYGYGKTKAGAKTAAAEMALKHVITTKLSAINNKPKAENFADEDVSMKMEGNTTSDEDAATSAAQQEEDVSWLHIASFAMHKLFSSWDSEGLFGEQQEVMTPINNPPVAKRPAKALPANPHMMNPVMLLNQMRPGITYEDVAREGNSPNTTFTIKTTLDGQEFYGKGSNKKLARKNCAYAACSKLFSLSYSTEDYQAIDMMTY